MKGKKAIKIIIIVLASLVLAFAATVGGYVAYVALQYYRIADNKQLTVNGEVLKNLRTGEEYSVMSYNLGFGAYSPEYSFFMDTGVMDDGAFVTGKYAKGMNKRDVEKNVAGGSGRKS